MISFASPAAQYRAHSRAIHDAIQRVLDSGVYILGREVEAFERAFADYCGVAHGVGVGSGTDALILALRALGVGAGDEVITVSHTAIATGAAILATGATPVLVDVEPAYHTMDPTSLERAITARTKAVIAVHLYGHPADMDSILPVARTRRLAVVEDCAQAVGSRIGSRRVGGFGDIACFSFYPTKNLGAIGDGGMAVTNDGGLAERLRRLRQYGWDAARATHECGLNSRLDTLQAAILSAKLPEVDAENSRRGAIAEQYRKGLSGLPIVLPAVRPGATHVYHLYVIATDRRDDLMAHLTKEGIGSAIHYPVPIHRSAGYLERLVVPLGGLPVTDGLVPRILSLPIYPGLSDHDVGQVVTSIRSFFGHGEAA